MSNKHLKNWHALAPIPTGVKIEAFNMKTKLFGPGSARQDQRAGTRHAELRRRGDSVSRTVLASRPWPKGQ